MSSDPALGSYLGNKPSKLPGQGGVFNPVNFALFSYAGNNPIKYTDPNGMSIVDDAKKIIGKVWSFITGGNKGDNKKSSTVTTDTSQKKSSNIIAQKDYKDKIGYACSIVAAYDSAVTSGSTHNKSDTEVVNIIYDQTIKKGDWIVTNSLSKIFEKEFDYIGSINNSCTEKDLNNYTADGGFVILQFKQTDLYDGNKFGYDYHWIGYVGGKYIDPFNGGFYNSINELKKGAGFPVNNIDLTNVVKGYIFRPKK